MQRPRSMLGQLLLGELAERAFERIYKETMGTGELILEDDRVSRNETDYRVLNGQRRPVFRINIKFHGTLFRNAQDLVGLRPEDRFALATYKIYQGLLKHENERLPYVFVIVSVPGLTGASVGAVVPDDLVHLVSLLHAAKDVPGKRGIEERVIANLVDSEQSEPFRSELTRFREEIEACAMARALREAREFATSRQTMGSRVRRAGARLRTKLPECRARHALLAHAGSHASEDVSRQRDGTRAARFISNNVLMVEV